MLEVILSIGVLALVINTIFTVAYALSLKRTAERVNQFIGSANEDALRALSDLGKTLANMNRITDDVSAVTDDVRRISHAVANVESEIRNLFGELKQAVADEVDAQAAGLKAGIIAGAVALVKNRQERGDHHEGDIEQ